MGSQEFSVRFLDALINEDHEIISVFTREPKPAGRNKELTKTAVQIFSEKNNLPICVHKSLKNVELGEFSEVDFIVVVGYGLILPSQFVNHPRIKCINVHPSLLPRWRGAAPIERTLWNGDKKTAATIMLMDEGLDTGDIISMEEMDVKEDDNFQTLSKKLSDSSKKQLLSVISNYDSYVPKNQPKEGIIYAEKLTSLDKNLEFSNKNLHSSIEIHNRVRALSGKSGLTVKVTNLDETFKIFESKYTIENITSKYGKCLIKDKEFYISCIDGLLLPTIIQKTTGKGSILNNKEFSNYIKGKLTD